MLDGADGVIVQLVVGGFLGIAGPEVEVGLIPYFEIPVCDFGLAVPID